MKNISTIILILLTILPSAAIANDREAYKKYGHKSSKCSPLIEAGLDAYESQNMDAAIKFFLGAVEKGCRDSIVFYRLGLYYEMGKDLAKAEKYYQMAVKNPSRGYPLKTIHEDLGRVLFSLGNIGGAKRELEMALKTQGENFSLMFLLGSIARRENDNSGVVKYYTKALALNPPVGVNTQETMLTLLTEIGKSHFNLGQYDQSMAIWNQVLRYFPNNAIANQYMEKIKRLNNQMNNTTETDEQKALERILN